MLAGLRRADGRRLDGPLLHHLWVRHGGGLRADAAAVPLTGAPRRGVRQPVLLLLQVVHRPAAAAGGGPGEYGGLGLHVQALRAAGAYVLPHQPRQRLPVADVDPVGCRPLLLRADRRHLPLHDLVDCGRQPPQRRDLDRLHAHVLLHVLPRPGTAAAARAPEPAALLWRGHVLPPGRAAGPPHQHSDLGRHARGRAGRRAADPRLPAVPAAGLHHGHLRGPAARACGAGARGGRGRGGAGRLLQLRLHEEPLRLPLPGAGQRPVPLLADVQRALHRAHLRLRRLHVPAPVPRDPVPHALLRLGRGCHGPGAEGRPGDAYLRL
mmetsp:Transcript_36411/g.93914  ORF Transcript_36411/g.93914 Transcript_36411/m.93914 type:complete len:323 (+) Transcript_36411:343-1311(+)